MNGQRKIKHKKATNFQIAQKVYYCTKKYNDNRLPVTTKTNSILLFGNHNSHWSLCIPGPKKKNLAKSSTFGKKKGASYCIEKNRTGEQLYFSKISNEGDTVQAFLFSESYRAEWKKQIIENQKTRRPTTQIGNTFNPTRDCS